MSADANFCTLEHSGWSPDAVPENLSFATRGRSLAAELRRWEQGDLLEEKELFEEVGAVLSGRFELRSDTERYELAAGQAIMIPAGEPRSWRLLTEVGVLYRVRCA